MNNARKPANNDRAISALIAKKSEIDAMLARLVEFSDNHFEVGPDEVTWGNVGTATELANMLRRATDWAFAEGENA